MSNVLRLLILEDRPADAELMLHELLEAGYEPVWERVEDEQGYVAALSSAWDVILADYHQPEFDALRALRILQDRALKVPLIVVTAVLGDEGAAQCIKAGASDYLLKDRLARLGQAVARAIADAHDRAERLRVEQALQGSEELYRTLVESVDDAIYVKDSSGRLMMVNSAMARRFERSVAEMIGTTISEYLTPDAGAISTQDDWKVMNRGEVADYETEYAAPKETRVFHVRKTPLRNAKGEIIGAVGVSRDVTERKRVEGELLFWRRDWEEVFQSIGDPTMILDRERRVVSANRALLRALGKSGAEELVGKDCRTLLIGADGPEPSCPLEEALASKRQVTMETPLASLGGTFLVTCTPITDGPGGRTRMLLAAKDITALRQSMNRLDETLRGTIRAMAALVERRDPYTAGHQRRVANLAAAIAREMGLSEEQTTAIELAGAVHDIGKITVPAEILSKPGALSSVEFQMIRSHVEVGNEVLGTIAFPWPIAQIVDQHHERLDGTGYPLGLTCKEIMLEARVMAVADTVEAMASHRPYRPAHSMGEAMEEIIRGRGVLFDATVVDACIRLLTTAGSQSAGVWFGNRPYSE